VLPVELPEELPPPDDTHYTLRISSKAVEFVGNARALSKDLWSTRKGCPSGPAKSTALEAREYVGNPSGLSKPCGKPVRVFHRAAYSSACLYHFEQREVVLRLYS
jgi:hypothetical protein